MAVAPAASREFRVLWYEAHHARSLFAPGQQVRALPRRKPTRTETFHVKARTLDGARRAAREYVAKRLKQNQVVLSINFTQRPNELVVYTGQKQESP